MPQNPLQQPVPGDPPSLSIRTARQHNLAARANARGTFGAQRPGGRPFAATTQTGIVYVLNATGTDQDQFAVYGIDEPIILPSDNPDEFKKQATVKGVVPTTNDHQGKFVIAIEPIAADEVGRAVVSGAAIAVVNILDVGHRFADVKDGDATQLESAIEGAAVILWAESGTGEAKLAEIRIGAGGAAVPVPEYVHMFLGAVAANTIGGEFPTYHPLIL